MNKMNWIYSLKSLGRIKKKEIKNKKKKKKEYYQSQEILD